MEQVLLVNEEDIIIGKEEKIKAHVLGLKHRAFSVFLLNSKGELLVQKRAKSKYHCPLQIANSCCSHQREGENTLNAAKRRLKEELGIKVNDLKEVAIISYNLDMRNGLIENEVDHILIGKYDGEFSLNKEEVDSVMYLNLEYITNDMKLCNEKYTPWFIKIFPEVKKYLK